MFNMYINFRLKYEIYQCSSHVSVSMCQSFLCFFGNLILIDFVGDDIFTLKFQLYSFEF